MAVPRRKPRGLAEQALALGSRYPEAQRAVVRHNRLRWRVSLRPTPMSVAYSLQLTYISAHRPVVHVLDPPLQRRPGRELPHVYAGDELCLYFPGEFDGRRDLLADAVVPWMSEWLFYYEAWLATGEWLGGGEHPAEAG